MTFTLGRQQYQKYSEKISHKAQRRTDVIFAFKFRTHWGGGETTDFAMIGDYLSHLRKSSTHICKTWPIGEEKDL